MSEHDIVARSEVLALASRIRELEAEIIRVPGGERRGDTNCTNCDTNCTNCAGDRFREVLLPGEFDRVSGAALVKQLRAGRE